ncbi:DedA family protein [Qipengyuania sp. 6B39]|uniref:DedA family protein n=1 Tax=Qipengyuania proteolytica TaxID=2867239 RepID=UPI001C891AEB|nr:DedA family protein [Qipengyuania proteolytica]MBX7496072.1 DedA family protein [Qipengyuania proteolytica]
MNSFILGAIASGGYLGIFLLMALENIFPPVPSEIIMGYSGVLVARGEMDFAPVLVIGTLGTVAGNYFWYWLGHRWKEDDLKRFIAKYGRWLTFEWSEFIAAREKFRRHGDWIVFLLRASPFLRTIISLPAGLARMKLWRFLLFTFLGSLVWNGALILGGGALSGVIERYETYASWAIGAFIGLGIAWYVWRVVTWEPS